MTFFITSCFLNLYVFHLSIGLTGSNSDSNFKVALRSWSSNKGDENNQIGHLPMNKMVEGFAIYR